MLHSLRRSLSAELFHFAFIDYDCNTKSNKCSLEYFDGYSHRVNWACPSKDWIIWKPLYYIKYH